APGPVLGGPEEAPEPGPRGAPGQHRPIVAGPPARKRAVASALARRQAAPGHDRMGPEGGRGLLRMARRCSALSTNNAVLNSTGIMRLSSQRQEVTQTSMAESADDCKRQHTYYECRQIYTL